MASCASEKCYVYIQFSSYIHWNIFYYVKEVNSPDNILRDQFSNILIFWKFGVYWQICENLSL